MIKKIQPKTLQQRITFFVLLPVSLLMVVMGFVGFLYARDIILKQWGETAITKLQRAAHKIDMRLNRPKEMLLQIHNEIDSNKIHSIHEFIIEQLKAMDGVAEVNVNWPLLKRGSGMKKKINPSSNKRMRNGRMSRIQTSLPAFNHRFNSETISIATDFFDTNGKKLGDIEVVIEFHDLVDQILKTSWWKSNKAFIIDNEGNILSSTFISLDEHIHDNRRQFGETDNLEKATLKAIQTKKFGTVFGPGHPPDEIGGFYHLDEASWNIVMIAPGKKILDPLIKFRIYYSLGGFVFIFLIIIFIRRVLYKTTDAIKNLSNAAKTIANGQIGPKLSINSLDEVGKLTKDFNTMSEQLTERLKLREEMNLAMEMQQNLLPPPHFSNDQFEISGTTIYCDKTGGDYFDIIQIPQFKEKIFVVVGDVAGHGIGSALLMTTTRALVRSCLMQNGSISKSINQVNNLLYQDTATSGNFVTLFIMMLDTTQKEIQWIRAGHDPAILYNPETDQITELKGKGLVLGVDPDWNYTENHLTDIKTGSSCLIFTDGASELENSEQNRFGKNQLKKIIQNSHNSSSKELIELLTSDLNKFLGVTSQKDDITLVAIKFN